jgi:serine/threonine protein kinase
MVHPPPSRLLAYLRDQATPEEVAHIERCPQCTEEIRKMMPPSDPTMNQQLLAANQLPTPIRDPQPTPVHIGRYTIDAVLHRSMISSVFRAHAENLQVVIKLPCDYAGRTQREIYAQMQFQSPYLVRLIEQGELNGAIYFVLEYVDGFTFHDLVAKFGPLPIGVACKLVQEAARGLAVLHQRSFIHRDVKTANLMLSRTGQVKVIDLGLVLLPPDQTQFTVDTVAFGTPDFMSPEQWQDAHNVDARTDLYALGMVLYALLQGSAAFGNLPTLPNKMNAHFNEPIPAMQRTDLPTELWQLILKLLAKDRKDRPASALALAEELEPFAQGINLGNWLENPNAPKSGEPGASATGVRDIQTPVANALGSPERLVCDLVNSIPPTVIPMTTPPLQAKLDLLFYDETKKRMRSVVEPGVLPVASGATFQIDLRLNRPAHAYLLWIDPQGEVRPVYPWEPNSAWKLTGNDEPLQGGLLLPKTADGKYARWPLSGPGGVETVVLLAREEPLTKREQGNFSSWVARIPPMPKFPEDHAAAFFASEGSESGKIALDRGFEATVVEDDNPLFQIDSLLRERFGSRFDLIQAISFTNRGVVR